MTDSHRDAALRQMLTDRQCQLQDDLHAHLREGRADQAAEGRDDMELSDDNIRGDLAFALLQMKSETVAQLEAALLRLDAGRYGDCITCELPIPKARLAALPFAARCQPCASRRERRLGQTATPSRWDQATDPASFRA